MVLCTGAPASSAATKSASAEGSCLQILDLINGQALIAFGRGELSQHMSVPGHPHTENKNAAKRVITSDTNDDQKNAAVGP